MPVTPIKIVGTEEPQCGGSDRKLVAKIAVGRRGEFIPLMDESEKPEPKEDPHERDQSKLVILPDGRSLAFAQYGDPTSTNVILLLPPLEGIRTFGRWFDQAAKNLRCRILCPDRPGFGFSNPLPNRTFTDFPHDLRVMLSVLRLEKVLLIGHSAGAVYATAFAIQYPNLVSAVALMAPWAPLNSRGFPWWLQFGHCLQCCTGQIAKTILQQHVAAFYAPDPGSSTEEIKTNREARKDNDRASRQAVPCPRRCCEEIVYYSNWFFAWLRHKFSWMCWFLQAKCCKPAPDRTVEKARMDKSLYLETNRAIARELFRQGSSSLSYELKLCMRRGSERKVFGGFSYSDITQPVTVFIGSLDQVTPPGVGRQIARNIPDAKLVEFPNSSHIMFVQQKVTEKIIQTVLASVPTRLAEEFMRDK